MAVQTESLRRALIRTFSVGEERAFRNELLQNSGDIHWLMEILRTGIQRHQDEALASIVDNLKGEKEKTLLAIRQEGGITELLELVKVGSVFSKQQAMCVVCAFAESQEHAGQLLEEGAVSEIIELLGSKNHAVKRQSVHAMLDLLRNCKEAKEKLVMQDGIVPLVDLVMQSDKVERRTAVDCLLAISSSSGKIHAILAGEGCVQVLLTLLDNGVKDCIRPAAQILANLSETQCVRKVMVENGAVPAVVKLLGTSDSDVREPALYVLANLSVQSTGRKIARKSGAVSHAVALLADESESIVSLAACVLANLAMDASGRSLIGETDAISKLARLFTSENAKCRRTATLATGNLARSAVIRDTIVKEGGVQPVLCMLHDPDNDCREEAVRALTNLCLDSVISAEVVQSGAVARLSELMKGGQLDTRRLAGKCLTVLSQSVSDITSVINDTVLEGFMGMLSDASGKCQEQGALTLSYIMRDSTDIREGVIVKGGVEMLAKLLTNKGKDGVGGTYAAMCLAHLVESEKSVAERMVEAEAVPAVVFLLKNPDDNVKKCAVKLVEALVLVPEQDAVIMHHGGVPALLEMLPFGDIECRERVASILGHLRIDQSIVYHAKNNLSISDKSVENSEGSASTETRTEGSSLEQARSLDTHKLMECLPQMGVSRTKTEEYVQVIREKFDSIHNSEPLEDDEIRLLGLLPERILHHLTRKINPHV